MPSLYFTCAMRTARVLAHLPDEGSQALLRHAVSPTVGHLTNAVGSGSHCLVARLQKPVPLQRLPSSILTQSESTAHAQASLPAAHLPALQTSPLVQASPSSQGPPPLTACMTHAPVFSTHLLAVQAVSATDGHEITVAGFALQTPVLSSSAQ